MATSHSEFEGDVFFPSEDIVTDAHVPDWISLLEDAKEDYLGFWEARASELEWHREWEQILDDSNPPFFKWFTGGKTNIVTNALDRHQETWRRNKLALIWEGEPSDVRTFPYHALNREVCRFANILKSMGARKGDRITIYMGRIPEIVMAMLACAKIVRCIPSCMADFLWKPFINASKIHKAN